MAHQRSHSSTTMGHHQRTHSSTMMAPASVITLSWEPDVESQIRQHIHDRFSRPETTDEFKEQLNSQPYMVAVIGIPGSGKSTSCSILTGLLRDVGCLLMPFDGYHLSRDVLQSFPNGKDAMYRRGAPDTFDVNALYRDLKRIRCGDEDIVQVPGFDHATADPEPNAHTFEREHHRVVVCEGLYLLHDSDGWGDIKHLFDLTIFVNSSVDVCINRLKQRNKCIPGYTPEEIEIRCDAVDRVNALTVMNSQYRADLVVESAATMRPTN